MKLARHLPKFLLLSLLVLPQFAAAQSGSTINRHLGGFFRPELGFGYVNSSFSQSGVDVTLDGGGFALGLAAGGALSEDFILGAQVWDVIANSPNVTIKTPVGSMSGSGGSGTSAGLVGYGLLLNWYMQPSNIYVAVTPSLTRLVANDGVNSSTTEWGFGLRGAVGKEWWVSDHWGVGISGALAFSSNKDSSASGAPTWTTFALSVGLSATYN